ncbi:MAG: insulinase family protein, partial [Deltaproteobacteria bacterium]|nr:insulinase family protein [Deltaproteobacteria bacterium]
MAGIRRIGRTQVGSVRGATVAFEPFRRARVASIQVWIRAGAAYETEHERGAAHFMEHMLFQNRPERFGRMGLGASVEDAGGTINAWTSQDCTVVHASFPAAAFGDAARAVLHNVLAAELLDPVVERERNVILQEISREEENPGLWCMRTLFEERYAGHAYGRRVVGTMQSVSALTADDLRRFHRAYYSPASLVVVVVGDLDGAEAFELVDRELAPWERDVPEAPRVPAAGRGRPGLRMIARDVAEAHFAIGFPAPALRHPDVPALDCASGVFGETRGSILESWRQATGLVNDVSSMSYTPIHGGLFGVHGSTHPDKLRAALDGLRDAFSEFVSSGPGLGAIAAVREDMSASSSRLDETAHGRAGRVGYELAAAGEAGFFRKYMARVLALDAEEVGRVLARHVGRAMPSVVLIAPEAALPPGAPAFRKVLRPRRASADEPTRTVLPGGTVVLHWRDRTHPTVVVRVHAPGGLEHETPETNGLHSLLSRLYSCGAGGRAAQALMRDFDALGAQFGAAAGNSFTSAWLDVPVGTLLPAAGLAAQCLSRPNLAEADVEREKALLLEDVRSRVDRPGSLLHRELVSRLFAGHPYGLDPAGRKEALDRIGRADLAATAERLLDPSRLVIAVVGDCDAAEVAALFVEPRPTGAPPPDPGPARHSAGGERVVIRGPFRQSHVGLIWPGVEVASPDRLPVSVFADALSMMSGPLFRVLREEMAQ